MRVSCWIGKSNTHATATPHMRIVTRICTTLSMRVRASSIYEFAVGNIWICVYQFDRAWQYKRVIFHPLQIIDTFWQHIIYSLNRVLCCLAYVYRTWYTWPAYNPHLNIAFIFVCAAAASKGGIPNRLQKYILVPSQAIYENIYICGIRNRLNAIRTSDCTTIICKRAFF